VEISEEYEQTKLVFEENNQSIKVAGGARGMIDMTLFCIFERGTKYFSPHVLFPIEKQRILMGHPRSEYLLHRCCESTY
jgi:hypothetical protein